MKIIALDFDGVICDSAREMASTSLKAAQTLYGGKTPMQMPENFVDQFTTLRPLIKTGYESIFLTILILRGIENNQIISEFKSLADEILREHSTNSDDLNHLFASVRDNWIATDVNGWLNLHEFYSEMIDNLKLMIDSDSTIFIITTKEKRFAKKLLDTRQIAIPAPHIFGLKEGSKINVLTQLVNRPEYANVPFIFIEDRLETLLNVSAEDDLHHVQLLLADWGYNSEHDRVAALKHSRISLLSLKNFTSILENR